MEPVFAENPEDWLGAFEDFFVTPNHKGYIGGAGAFGSCASGSPPLTGASR